MMELIYRYRQVIKFGLVGVANTLICFALLFFLDKVMGLGYQIANPIAYFLSTLNSFYLNKKWTFKSEGKARKEGALFFVVIGCAWGVQYLFLNYLVESLRMDDMVAQIVGMVIFTGLNFLGQKFITFKS
jgi:putative flippase GtrA